MPQRIPIFRAARLMGVSRSALLKSIRKQNISTFDGEISIVILAVGDSLGTKSSHGTLSKIFVVMLGDVKLFLNFVLLCIVQSKP